MTDEATYEDSLGFLRCSSCDHLACGCCPCECEEDE